MCPQPDVFAIIGRGLYAEVDPGRFGNLGVACYTLFQLMTLDDWFYMYSEVAERHPGVLLLHTYIPHDQRQPCHIHTYIHNYSSSKTLTKSLGSKHPAVD